jgi:O-antigen ligase
MGPAGYAVYYMTYNPNDARSTHNNYFDVLAQTGIIGFGVFIWLMGTYVITGNRLRRVLAKRRNFEEAFAVATLAGCFGVLTAMMLGDWVLPFAYNQTISGFDNACFTWIFLGGMISLHQILKGNANAT